MLRSAIAVAGLILCGIPLFAAEPPGARRALLVGVTAYPNLAPKFQLQGPANDVVLMRHVLSKHFQFADANIVTLSEAAGEKDPAKFPMRANIEREFQALAANAKPNDTIFILMGGHGSQQPECNRPGAEPETDGLDEIFLPRDVGPWNDKAGSVANAIIDDDLGNWLKAIRAKGASVCIVLDACHSGTMTRGAGGEKLRQLDSQNDLGIPAVTIEKARQTATTRGRSGEKTRGHATEPSPFKLADKGGLVALYAAQPSEPTAECDLPPRDPKANCYGVLTFALCTALTQGVETSSKPLTYRELSQRVFQQYSAWGRTFPTPVIEGGDRDREFLGDKIWPGRSSYLLTQMGDILKVNVGSLSGMTPESIFAVSPPSGLGDKCVGHVRVVSVRPGECIVEPCEHAGQPKPTDLPSGGVCKVVAIDYGAMKLRVAVDSLDEAGSAIGKPHAEKLMATIRGMSGENSILEFQPDSKRADWLVRVTSGGKVILVPAAGAVVNTATGGSSAAFGPKAMDAKFAEWLKTSLENIARARNLVEIAGREDAIAGENAPKIELHFQIDGKPMSWPSPDAAVYDKEKLRVTFTNKGRAALDVTVLYIDSDYGIDCLFPKNNEFNRLKAGEKIEQSFTASAATTGLEHLLVIAVEAEGQATDFSGLAQPSLERYRQTQPTTRGCGSALHSLLKKAAFGEGTRGIGVADDQAGHTMKLIPLTAKPGKRMVGSKP